MPTETYSTDEVDTKLLEYTPTSDLPDYSQFVTDSGMAGYVTEQLAAIPPAPDLSQYAKKTDIPAAPDLSGYATKSYVDNAVANVPGGGGSPVTNVTIQSGASTNVLVDSLGTTDDARIAKLNSLHGQRLVFEFASRTYNTATQIEQWAGLKLVGSGNLPAREFGTGTVINYTVPNSSTFKTVVNTGYGYPGNGEARDITLSGIEFTGNSTSSVFPKSDMVYANATGKKLWYYNIDNCGVNGMNSFLWGYVTGVSITGTFHAQAMIDTSINVAGSECVIFDGGQSLMDNSTAAWASSGKPLIRIATEKSYIGHVMVSSRGNSYGILVDGGRNVMIDGVQFDGPAGSLMTNPALKITSNVESVTVTNCSFKGINTQSGLITSAATQANISNNSFTVNDGAPGGDTPLVTVTAGIVKFGLNLFPGFNGKLKKSGSAVIYNIDPMGTVTS